MVILGRVIVGEDFIKGVALDRPLKLKIVSTVTEGKGGESIMLKNCGRQAEANNKPHNKKILCHFIPTIIQG